MELKLKSGEVVINRYNSHIHGEIESILKEALEKISSQGRGYIEEEVEFGRIIGFSQCVLTTDDDEIVFLQRAGRKGKTRFVKNRKPEPSSKMFVVLKKDPGGFYIIITAFVGERPEPEPWDEYFFSKQKDPEERREKAKKFWETHALVSL